MAKAAGRFFFWIMMRAGLDTGSNGLLRQEISH